MSEIAGFIVDTLINKYDLPEDEVSSDSSFEDLDIDSLTLLEILVMIEGRFGIVIPEGELSEKQTISEAAAVAASFEEKVA